MTTSKRRPSPSLASPANLSPRDPKDGNIRVVIETPKGSRNKYAFNEELRSFELKKVLPAGMMFPYDFGFVPGTRADDGDPLDVLVLMDQPAFTGCIVTCRIIGIIRGQQEGEDGKEENDRVVAVEVNNHSFSAIRHLDDLGERFVHELEEFFVNYHDMDGEKYTVTAAKGPKVARKCLEQAIRKTRR